MEDGAVLKDARHDECYLRINPRHARESSANRLVAIPFKKSRGLKRAWGLVLVEVIIAMVLCLLPNVILLRGLFNI